MVAEVVWFPRLFDFWVVWFRVDGICFDICSHYLGVMGSGVIRSDVIESGVIGFYQTYQRGLDSSNLFFLNDQG